MPQFHTVIPIQYVELDPATSYEFSGGLMLTALPAWIRGQKMLDRLSVIDREAVKQATHAFVLSYTADALGSPDPEREGTGRKSIQENKYEIGVMANLALWLTKPSPAPSDACCFGWLSRLSLDPKMAARSRIDCRSG